MLITKKTAPKLIFFNEGKIRNICTLLDCENWLWKSDLGTFWRPMWTSAKVKSKNCFNYFLCYNLTPVDSCPQNSTTEDMLVTCLFYWKLTAFFCLKSLFYRKIICFNGKIEDIKQIRNSIFYIVKLLLRYSEKATKFEKKNPPHCFDVIK